MATVVLGIVGSYIGGVGTFAGVVAGVAGAAIGSYIDNKYLFPPQEFERPRVLGDLRTQGASEGMGFNFAIGPEVRVPGKVVYVGPEQLQLGSEVTVAIDVCGGEIVGNDAGEFVKEIYANGQKILSTNTYAEVTFDFPLVKIYRTGTNGGQGSTVFLWHFDVQVDASISTNPDLNIFDVGVPIDVEVLGLAPGVWMNHSTATWDYVAKKGFFSPGYPTAFHLQIVHEGHLLPDGADDLNAFEGPLSVKLSQTTNEFDTGTFTDLAQYRGTNTQEADPSIVAQVDPNGDGLVPYRRGRAYIVLNNLKLDKFGGSVPNFEVVIEERPSMTTGEALGVLLGRHGIGPSLYDVSEVTGDIRGLVGEEPIDSKGMIQALMMAKQIGAREINGRLHFYMRVDSDIVQVSSESLGAHIAGGAQTSRSVSRSVNSDRDVPSRVDIEFSNSDNDYQQGNARESHHGLQTPSEKVDKIRTPLTLSQAEADLFARFVMVQNLVSRETRGTVLPPEYVHVCEGDIWKTTVEGEQLTSIATGVEYSPDGLVRLVGYREQPHTYDLGLPEIASSDQSVSGGTTLEFGLKLHTWVGDIAPLDTFSAQNPVVHFVSPDLGSSQPFQGGSLFRNLFSETSFTETGQLVPSIASEYALVADGDHALPIALGTGVSEYHWDEVSTITITPQNIGALSEWVPTSALDDADVASGANRAVYGREVIAYRDVLDNGDGTYTLSRFLRGLRGTDDQTVHDLEETFIGLGMLGPGLSGNRHEMDVAHAQFAHEFKCVNTNSWDEAEITAVSITPTFRGMTPLKPYALTHYEDSVGNHIFQWSRQVRTPWPIFTNPVPPAYELNNYEVKIKDHLGGLAYEETITGTNVYVLSSADFATMNPTGFFSIEVQQYGPLEIIHSPAATKVITL
jgi:hypothetical protein